MNTSTSSVNSASVSLNLGVQDVVELMSRGLPELRKMLVEQGNDKSEVSKWNKEYCVGKLLSQHEVAQSLVESSATDEDNTPVILRPESEALRRYVINQGSFRLIDRTSNGLTKVYGCLRFNRGDWSKNENKLAIQIFLGQYARIIEMSTDEKTGYGQIIIFSSIKMYESLRDHCQMALFPEWMTIRIEQEADRQSKLWNLLYKRQEGAAEMKAKKEASPSYRPIKKDKTAAVVDANISDPWDEDVTVIQDENGNVIHPTPAVGAGEQVVDYAFIPF